MELKYDSINGNGSKMMKSGASIGQEWMLMDGIWNTSMHFLPGGHRSWLISVIKLKIE